MESKEIITKEGEILSPLPETEKATKIPKFKSDLERSRWNEFQKLENDLRECFKENAKLGFIIQGRATSGRLIYAFTFQAIIEGKCLGKLNKLYGEYYPIKRITNDILEIGRKGFPACSISYALQRYAQSEKIYYNIGSLNCHPSYKRGVVYDNLLMGDGNTIVHQNFIYNLSKGVYDNAREELLVNDFNQCDFAKSEKEFVDYCKSKVDKLEPYEELPYSKIKMTQGIKVILDLPPNEKKRLSSLAPHYKAGVYDKITDRHYFEYHYLKRILSDFKTIEDKEKNNDVLQNWGIN